MNFKNCYWYELLVWYLLHFLMMSELHPNVLHCIPILLLCRSLAARFCKLASVFEVISRAGHTDFFINRAQSPTRRSHWMFASSRFKLIECPFSIGCDRPAELCPFSHVGVYFSKNASITKQDMSTNTEAIGRIPAHNDAQLETPLKITKVSLIMIQLTDNLIKLS